MTLGLVPGYAEDGYAESGYFAEVAYGIKAQIQLLEQSAEIELFIIDLTNFTNGGLEYFHAGTNKLSEPLVWQGQTYTPLPIEASGFDLSTQGALPRPKLRMANVNGLVSANLKEFDDFIGCKVTRKRTYACYLDSVNFPDGNTTANPDQYLPDEIWYIDRKASETRYLIEFELASAFDLNGAKLPARQVIQNSCSWKYRGAECRFTSTAMFDENNAQTSDVTKDTCPKTLTACHVRQGAKAVRFGGFPGSTRGAK